MRLRPGTLAANRRRGGGTPPALGAHRYWRVVFTAQASNRVALGELEFLDRRYYRRKDGTFTGSGAWSPANAVAYAFDQRWTSSTSSGFWRSQVSATPGTIWLKLDTGAGQECPIEGVMFTKASSSSGEWPQGFEVQWSDDDSTWTTEWSVADSLSVFNASIGTARPIIFTNPLASEFEPTVGFDTNDLVLWLKSYDGAFTDDYTTPATPGSAVKTMTNHAPGSSEVILQSVLGNRPILRAGGRAGLPYLEFDKAEEHHFEDIALVGPSGSTANYPGHVGFLGDVTPLTTEIAGVLGSAVSVTLKTTFYFRPNADEQYHWRRATNRFGNFGTPGVPTILGFGGNAWNFNAFFHRDEDHQDGDLGFTTSTGTSTLTSTAPAVAQLFRHTAESGNTHFDGRVYELIVRQEKATQGITYDAFVLRQAFCIQEYLYGRSLFGVPS